MALPSAPLQLFKRTGNRRGNERIKAVEHIESTADADKSGQLRGYGPGLKPLDGALGNAGLGGELRLRPVVLQPETGDAAAKFGQNSAICGLFFYIHNSSNMANIRAFVNYFVINDEL